MSKTTWPVVVLIAIDPKHLLFLMPGIMRIIGIFPMIGLLN